MRRSSSSSSIPTRVSRLPVRESLHSVQNPGRSVSKPQVRERLSSLSKLPRTSSNSNLLDIPCIRNKRSGSLVRQTISTPLNQHGYSRLQHRSPGFSSLKKDNRPITDKNWQFDQLTKVRHFVLKYFGHLELYDVNTIKSGIATDIFISLINNYFQILDNQAIISRETFMETVPKILKSFGYPGNVKPSLMKTVNTPHSWPHILAIFAWLSDLISEIDIPDEYTPFSGIYNVVYQDTLDLLKQLHSNDRPEEIIHQKCFDNIDRKIVEYLKLDVELLMDIDNQIQRLHIDIEKSETRNNDLISNRETVQTEIKELTEKCNTYEQQSKTFLTQLEQQKTKHLMKIQKMGDEVYELREKEKSLQAVIDTQPYSLAQKEELAKELVSLQVSKELKEQRHQQQQRLIHEYDSKLTELMQNIKSSAYTYNNKVNKLELSNPEFRKLHIRESGFARNDTDEELIGASKLLHAATEKILQGDRSCEDNIKNMISQEKKLSVALEDAVKEVEELKKLDAELEITFEFERKQADLKRRKLATELSVAQTKLTDLKKLHLDLIPLENQVNVLQKQNAELEKLLHNNKSESLDFFRQLQEQMNQTATSYMNILCSTFEELGNEVHELNMKHEQVLDSDVKEVQK